MKVIFVTFEKVNIEPRGEFLTIKIQNASKVFVKISWGNLK